MTRETQHFTLYIFLHLFFNKLNLPYNSKVVREPFSTKTTTITSKVEEGIGVLGS